MGRNKIFITFFLIFFSLFNIFSDPLSLIGKYIKLTVSDKNGGFLLYARSNVKDKWIPLLFEDELPTTYFRFYKDQKIFPFGEGGRGRYSELAIKDNTIVYFWNNNEIKIEVTYKLVASNKDNPLDTLLIDLNIINLIENIQNISFYFCIDTYLGELLKNPFILSDNSIIKREKEITDISKIPFVLSQDNDKKIGLNIILDNHYIKKPDRIFFANWKKLEQFIGPYKVQDDFDFDLKPYSIDDSALFIEYDNQKINLIKPNKYNFILSMKNKIVIDDKKTAEVITNKDNTTDLTTTTVEKNKNVDLSNKQNINVNELNLINMSLADLLALLDRINTKLENGIALTDEEVNTVNNILSEIKKRRNYP